MASTSETLISTSSSFWLLRVSLMSPFFGPGEVFVPAVFDFFVAASLPPFSLPSDQSRSETKLSPRTKLRLS